ncbi:MAG TPA: 16S rRNA (cytosine(1402)-N(4))-methyltransferase RsmH [Aliidongia sp.]|nr:16S rRNA (cytosine(1402)-N(4))-methyltransferase RsmH [Aliidongia sp.]
MSDLHHIPVLVDQVVLALAPQDGETIIDGTFGLGGYSRALLEAAPCRVVGIDRDPNAIAAGERLAASYPGRLSLIEGRFGQMERLLGAAGIDAVDGVALDLGVSSPQLDDPTRGFSFRFDGPLDMRMGKDGPSAATLVNTLGEAELADIIWRYGEERLSRRVAKAIVAAREEAPIERTAALARIVRSVVKASRDGIDPATRTFQALRIHTNDELGELMQGLSAAERLLKAGGRLAIVSFHSLEDRVIKQFLRERAGEMPSGSRHLPETTARRAPSFRLTQRKPTVADEAEIRRNPRARSAKLRVAERTAAPAWPAAHPGEIAP